MSAPSWETKPVLFLVLATAAILAGTIVTMVLPFVWVNSESDRLEEVKPYSALELEGRDIYIREGCNNCHTQTVRPLVAEVVRYGEYSRSGEYVYDRPHLWGSRRAGPDLARVGGKYPDAWHYRHMEDPQSIAPGSNMPAYAFLSARVVNPDLVRRKMDVLAFPYTEEDIAALQGKSEMDAMVAYLQKLGSDIPWRQAAAEQATPLGDLANPFPADPGAVAEGETLYARNCAGCHGAELQGGIGPALGGGWEEADLFTVIYAGIPAGGMPGFSSLGRERVWQIVNFIQAEGR